MSKYKKFCKIFFNAFAIAVVIGWLFLWLFVNDYEKNVAIHIVQDVVDDYQSADGASLLEHLDLELNDYEDAQQFSEYIESFIGNEQVKYAMVTSGSFENPEYLISKDDTVFEKMTLKSEGKSWLWHKKWSIDTEECSFAPLYNVTINAPANAKIEINGIEICDEAEQSDIILGLYDNIPDGCFQPKFNTYSLKGFYVKPKITAIGENGEECIIANDNETGTVYITTPATDEQYQLATKLTESFSASYYKYISGEAGFEVLNDYLYEGSSFYEYIKKQNVKKFVGHDSSSLESIKIENCQSYDNTQISCDVSFNFVYHINGEEYEYPSAYEINYIRDGETFKVVNLVAK